MIWENPIWRSRCLRKYWFGKIPIWSNHDLRKYRFNETMVCEPPILRKPDSGEPESWTNWLCQFVMCRTINWGITIWQNHGLRKCEPKKPWFEKTLIRQTHGLRNYDPWKPWFGKIPIWSNHDSGNHDLRKYRFWENHDFGKHGFRNHEFVKPNSRKPWFFKTVNSQSPIWQNVDLGNLIPASRNLGRIGHTNSSCAEPWFGESRSDGTPILIKPDFVKSWFWKQRFGKRSVHFGYSKNGHDVTVLHSQNNSVKTLAF